MPGGVSAARRPSEGPRPRQPQPAQHPHDRRSSCTVSEAGAKRYRLGRAEAHAPTLAYDYTLLGAGDVPAAIARAVAIPVLLLVGEESVDYKHTAVDALAATLPHIELVTTGGIGFEPTDELIERLVGFFAPVKAAEQPAPNCVREAEAYIYPTSLEAPCPLAP